MVRHRHVDTNGIRMHVAEAGPDDGPAVVLCHGFPECWYSWRHQLRALGDVGYHVLDCRGSGLIARLQEESDVHLALPDTTAFRDADLTRDPTADLDRAEH